MTIKDDTENEISSEDENEHYKKLLDSSYPLLQKFRDTCPGTYKHSQFLAQMVDGASLSLGLNPIFMRVCALYHDVGKMFNPKYFTENQFEDENPHDKLDPKISYQIISRHVSDTALILLNDGNFPRLLIDVVTQHHGTSLVRYFYLKSKSDVEDIFRYKGKKPVSIESMLLMVCDIIEARSRSDVQQGKYDPRAIIEETINGLLSDGQLDEVTMMLGDLQKIKIALAKELEGTYQKRVDYSKAGEEPSKLV
jgi:putative nucleotidyltransferase with HDIG domain